MQWLDSKSGIDVITKPKKLGSDKMCIIVPLDDDFEAHLYEVFDEELRNAQDAWGVDVSEESREQVKYYAFAQVKRRAGEMFRDNWLPQSKSMDVHVRGEYPPLSGTYVNFRNAKTVDMQLFFDREGWNVYQGDEDLDKVAPMHVSKLQEAVQGDLEKWLRVAVFYCVGSFEQQ